MNGLTPRATASALTLCALAACAASPPVRAPVVRASGQHGASSAASPETSAVAISGPGAARLAALLAAAGSARAPDRGAVIAALGPADVERREGENALLTWRGEECALATVFVRDRLAAAVPGARRAGAQTPTLGACAADLAARGQR